MQDQKVETFYTGLSGLQLPVPKYKHPPPHENSSRLTYYSTILNTIEFNSSFYKIPKVATVSKWVTSVSKSFTFTFKLWKAITHNRGLQFNTEDVSCFLASINMAKEKMGCLLIQFPPSLTREHSAQLEMLLSAIKADENSKGWKVAIEFRNNSWYHSDTYTLLDHYKAAIVIHDIPKSCTPDLPQSLDFVYVRFHGPTGNYRGSYANEFLEEYASYVQGWMEEGKTVYVYFNNTMGDAFNNSLFLRNKINSISQSLE